MTTIWSYFALHHRELELLVGIILPPIVFVLLFTFSRLNIRYFRDLVEDPWFTLFRLYCIAALWVVVYGK